MKRVNKPIKRTLAHRLKQMEESYEGLSLRLQNCERELMHHEELTDQRVISLGKGFTKTEDTCANLNDRLKILEQYVHKRLPAEEFSATSDEPAVDVLWRLVDGLTEYTTKRYGRRRL